MKIIWNLHAENITFAVACQRALVSLFFGSNVL